MGRDRQLLLVAAAAVLLLLLLLLLLLPCLEKYTRRFSHISKKLPLKAAAAVDMSFRSICPDKSYHIITKWIFFPLKLLCLRSKMENTVLYLQYVHIQYVQEIFLIFSDYPLPPFKT